MSIENRIDINALQRSAMFQGYRDSGYSWQVCPKHSDAPMVQAPFGCSPPDNL